MPAGWDLTAFLLADNFKGLTGQDHPARPKPAKAASTASRYSALRSRLEAQRARLETVQRIADNIEAAAPSPPD